MKDIKPGDCATYAAEMYNALCDVHNLQVDAFSKAGVCKEHAAVASYIALRVMLARFIKPVRGIVDPESWETIEVIIRLMRQDVDEDAPSPTGSEVLKA